MSTNNLLSAMTTRHVQVGARQIFIAEIGSGPVVLMLHGGGPGASGLSNYSKNIESLAQHYRVIVPDMPGYGQSTKGLNNKDPFGDLASGMLGLLDALKIDRAHLIGNSLGGACALRMALEQPSRVGRLILMGPGGIDTSRGLPTKGLRLLMNYYGDEGPSLEKMRDWIRTYLVYDGRQVPDKLIEQRYKASIDPEVMKHGSQLKPKGLPVFKNIDFTRDPRLPQLSNHTLVLWGTDDKVNRPSGAHSLQKRLANCDVYLFSKTGHWVQWERADEFNAIVLSFLAQDKSLPLKQAA